MPSGRRRSVLVKPHVWLRLKGRVLQAEISRCHASGFKSILLDLSRLDFIDSTGLWVITTARRWCETHGCGFMLIPGSEPVQSVFELTGLSDVLPFVTAEPSAKSA